MTANWTTQDLVALRFNSLNKKRFEISVLALLLVKGFIGQMMPIQRSGSKGVNGYDYSQAIKYKKRSEND